MKYLNCFVSPTHNLAGSDVCDRCGHFTPLEIQKNHYFCNKDVSYVEIPTCNTMFFDTRP